MPYCPHCEHAVGTFALFCLNCGEQVQRLEDIEHDPDYTRYLREMAFFIIMYGFDQGLDPFDPSLQKCQLIEHELRSLYFGQAFCPDCGANMQETQH